MRYEFRLPDIGEGVAEGEILKWMVKEGDAIKEDQPLVEVMTDKVNVQIPSPKTGSITQILAKEGEVVKVGQVIVVISGEGAEAEGPSTAGAVQGGRETQAISQMEYSEPTASNEGPMAPPATRRLARELGVDLGRVRGTGPHGRITDEDVKAASVSPARRAAQQAVSAKEERIPLRGVRKIIAERLARSSTVAAHVTHVDEADMTELVLLRESLRGTADKKGVKLTFMPFFIKGVLPALKEHPYVNSTFDESGTIVLKRYYNIGIATDTEQGLVVPVVKDADKKSIFELAAEIEQLAEKARSGRLGLEEVRGSTFTITNVGAIGGLFATPIINLPEVAIMGTHRISKRPVFREGKTEVREMMYLSLSFDHRVFDGAYAARFMNRVVETLQDPKKLVAGPL